MDFDLSDDQRLLKETVDRFIADDYGFEARKAALKTPRGYGEATYAKFAELGLLGLPFPEADGGFGAGAVETMIVMEAFGRGLVVEPFAPTVIHAGAALRHAASTAQKADLLPGLIDGTRTMALATTERHSRYDLFDVSTSARRTGTGFTLSGTKYAVVNGGHADTLIVSARVSGGRRDTRGVGLFVVPSTAKGVSRRSAPGQDGIGVGEITFENVVLGADAALGDPEGGIAVLEAVAIEAIAAHAAEAVGAMDDLTASTVDYLKTRKQFGVAIGQFQALQHRASEMFVALEQARSMMLGAAMAVDMPDRAEAARLASAAKVQIGRSARFIGQSAIQLYGGNGMTMEYKAGHSFKRLAIIDTLFGDADHHLARLAGEGGLAA